MKNQKLVAGGRVVEQLLPDSTNTCAA